MIGVCQQDALWALWPVACGRERRKRGAYEAEGQLTQGVKAADSGFLVKSTVFK
jgi:hypothetical protein